MNSELSMDQVLIEKLNNILEVNLDKEHFGVKELAFEAGLSRSQLHRKLQSIKGKSSSKFICEFRLKKAMVMLRNNVATASEIAYRVGFSSPTYFNTCFHDYYGYPPGEAKIRNPNGDDHNEDEQVLKLIDGVQAISVQPSVKKNVFGKRMVWINTLFIILLSVITYNLYQNYKDYFSNESAYLDDHNGSVAILPFKNLSEAKDDEFFTMGVTSSLQNQLNTIKGLKVISSNSMEKYTNTKMSPSEIANEIGVTYLLDGSVQKYGDSIKVIINFINASENHQLSSLVYIEEFNNVFALQSKIAKQVTQELNINLSNEELEQFDKNPTDNLEAYNLYLIGHFFWHQRTEKDLNKSIYYFNRALELDSMYALAYAGLADTYYIMAWWGWYPNNEGFEKGKEFALKALSIDNNMAEAHATLGAIANWKEWNWKDAEKELKLAITLNPNNATAHQYYAELLNILGRNEEAREQIDLALELNPFSYAMNLVSAYYYYNSNDYYNAIEAHKRNIDLANSNNGLILSNKLSIIRCYLNLGMNKDALELIKDFISIDNHHLLDKIFEESGIKGVTYWFIDWLLDNKLNRNVNFTIVQKGRLNYTIARFYGCIGDSQNALKYLEYFFEDGNIALPRMNNSPDFSFIRTEPRFIALLEKMNLGDYE